jgi:hypothetical protein
MILGYSAGRRGNIFIIFSAKYNKNWSETLERNIGEKIGKQEKQ